jgi:hypothetical protein
MSFESDQAEPESYFFKVFGSYTNREGGNLEDTRPGLRTNTLKTYDPSSVRKLFKKARAELRSNAFKEIRPEHLQGYQIRDPLDPSFARRLSIKDDRGRRTPSKNYDPSSA